MNDFTSGNVTRQLIRFSLPMLIGNLFQQLYSMADAVVVGRFVGGESLAAVGMAMNVLQFLLSVLIGLTTGASVIISQFYGAKRFDKIESMMSVSVFFLSAFTLLIAIPGIIFAPALFRALDASQLIIDDAIVYMRILVAGIVFPVFYNMFTAYLRAIGDSKRPLYILICCTLLNIVLDLIFVVVFDMGVEGAAFATIISQAVSVALCFVYTRRFVPLLQIKGIAFDRELFFSIIKYGLPAAIQLSVVSLAQLTITRLINSFGPAAMAGITAASKIDNLAIMPVATVTLAQSSFVGQNMGANREERAKKGFHAALGIMVSLAVVISVFLYIFAPNLVLMFLDTNEVGTAQILGYGTSYLSVIVIFYFLFAVLFAFNGFFRGAGDAVIAMVFPITSLTVRTVVAHLLVDFGGMGPEALAWSMPVGWALCSAISFVYYKKRMWAGKAITMT